MGRWVGGGLISQTDGPGFGKTQTRHPRLGKPQRRRTQQWHRRQHERIGDTSQSCVGHRVPLETPTSLQTSNAPGTVVSSSNASIRHSDELTHARDIEPGGVMSVGVPTGLCVAQILLDDGN
jgi:hypothetical protein